MAKVKIRNIETGAVKEVEKSLASDYIGTKKFVLYEEKKSKTPFVEEPKKPFLAKEEKDA